MMREKLWLHARAMQPDERKMDSALLAIAFCGEHRHSPRMTDNCPSICKAVPAPVRPVRKNHAFRCVSE
jgi:hypothetical protein